MSLKHEVISVGFDKDMEPDYALSVGRLARLSLPQMDKLRIMLSVAIGQVEQYWYAAQMRKPENQAQQNTAE